MKATEIKLFSLDLLIELDSPSGNPALALVSSSGLVREAGPAHAAQAEPIRVGDRVVVLTQGAKYLVLDGAKCALVGVDALVWRFAKD